MRTDSSFTARRLCIGPGSGAGPLLTCALAVGLLLSGCFTGGALEPLRSLPSGTVHLSSSALGDLQLAPTACTSGERSIFLGADFLMPEGITTRLIIDPSGGTTLRFFRSDRPLEPGVLFSSQDCTQLELRLERTGWRINDVYDLRVHLELDCVNASGDAARGLLSADRCH